MSCCEDRRGKAGANWHYSHKTPLCENARVRQAQVNEEYRRRKAAEAGRRYIPRSPVGTTVHRIPRWTPGSPILVEEIEEL